MSLTPIENDAFECFGAEDEDDEMDVNDNDGIISSTKGQDGGNTVLRRDPTCGILAFHKGTEQALLNYIRLEMEGATSSNKATKVLESIDKFCYQRHWMMHVGPEKCETLREFLKECCLTYQESKSCGVGLTTTMKKDHLVVVELGTYCGYSSIFMANTIMEIDKTLPFHILSIDVDPKHQGVAQQLALMAEVENFMSFLVLNNPDDRTELTRLLRTVVPFDRKIDFLFLDHDKDYYITDLKQLEGSGMIRSGTHVAADNVVVFDFPYCKYIAELVRQGTVRSRLAKGYLEYADSEDKRSGNFADGIELSVYQMDP